VVDVATDAAKEKFNEVSSVQMCSSSSRSSSTLTGSVQWLHMQQLKLVTDVFRPQVLVEVLQSRMQTASSRMHQGHNMSICSNLVICSRALLCSMHQALKQLLIRN
jgi:hypothetical protein